jgi:hypothetical protein
MDVICRAMTPVLVSHFIQHRPVCTVEKEWPLELTGFMVVFDSVLPDEACAYSEDAALGRRIVGLPCAIIAMQGIDDNAYMVNPKLQRGRLFLDLIPHF